MLTKIKNIIMVVSLLWAYRRVIYAVICDIDNLSTGVKTVRASYEQKEAGRSEAQKSILSLLSLRSFTEIVKVTESYKDDDALLSLKACVANNDIFGASWRIVIGNWDISTDSARWSDFISRLKRILPFMPNEKAVNASSSGYTLDADADVSVTEVVGIVVLILTTLPKITAIIERRRKIRGKLNGGKQ